MKTTLYLLLWLLATSCHTTKISTYWVSGMKVDCTNGIEKGKCLQVHEGEITENLQWKPFYETINGFVFKEGVMQKIRIEEKSGNASSSKQYTLVSILESKQDRRVILNDTWLLDRIEGKQVTDKKIKIEITINSGNREYNGTDGCNNYFGLLKHIDSSQLLFEPQASTKKLCLDIPNSYFFHEALTKVHSYEVTINRLTLFSEENKELLSFYSKNNSPSSNLDVWSAIRINGNPIVTKSAIPKMELNLENGKIFGNNGCNNFNASIKKLTASEVVFGPIAETRMMCPDLKIPDQFTKAIKETRSYKLLKQFLILYNGDGKELIAFKKE